MKVQAYVAFDGNCQEALNFYGELFNADTINKQTYEDKKIDEPASYRSKLQHAELKGKGVHIVAYNAAPDTPILVHANAGMPHTVNGETVFPEKPEEMAINALKAKNAGANILGGCCGTTPAHITKIAEVVKR